MKNMKKLVALFAATVMTLSFGVSAFAVAVDTDASDYDATDDTVFNLVFTAPDGSEAAQLTMIAYLVDDDDYTSKPIPDYSSQEVVAIDQVGGNQGFGTVPVDTEKLEEGYAIAVAIGGTGDDTPDKYLVTYNKATETIEVKIADINGDGDVNITDTNAMITYIKNNLNHPDYAIGTVITGSTTKLGDITGDGDVNITDTNAFITFVKNNLNHPDYNFGATVTVNK